MLAIFLLFYFSKLYVDSRAILPRYTQPEDVGGSACDCPDTRTLFDIIWSCFSTIFICTWVSVHPNLPPPGDSFVWTTLRRLKIMLYTFLVPELILTWAMSQWYGARKVASTFSSRGWTKTHGFFLGMGGFHLHRQEESLGVLSFDLLSELDASGEIEFPTISAKDIEDKSKGDFVAKSIALFQTTWFIIQCIARGVQGLGLTELELLTLALASMNAAMYFFWWSKPLDAQAYVPVYLKPSALSYTHKRVLKRTLDSEEVHFERAIRNAKVASTGPSGSLGGYLPEPLRKGAAASLIRVNNFLDKRRDEWKTRNRFYFILRWFLLVPLLLPVIPLLEFGDNETIELGANHVSTFYGFQTTHSQDLVIGVTFGFFGVAFGGLHLIAWGFTFPSYLTQILWRASALVVTCAPFITAAIALVTPEAVKPPDMGWTRARWWEMPVYYMHAFAITITGLAFSAYVPARFILVIEALVLLKNLPADAFAEVEWTRFIPHIR